jgi:two-component system NarL family sensor kinase
MQSIDKQLVIGVIITLIVIFSLLIFIVAVVVLYQRKLREKQQSLFQSVIDAEEKERTRIAKDLHDSLGASLSAVKLYFEGLKPSIPDQEKSTLVYDMLADACNEVRAISHQMMPQVLLREGLFVATRQFCTPFMNLPQLKFELNILGPESRPNNPTTELMIYRVLQELINNSLKHSKATEIIVQLIQSKNELILSVEDNGIGGDIKINESSNGLVISNLVSRVKYLNGQITFDNVENSGLTALVRIPF